MSDLQMWTPVGRIVQGHPLEVQNTKMNGAPLTDKAGNPRVEYFVAVAVAKIDPAMVQIWQQFQTAAAAGFPGGEATWPTFAWKIIDGDLPQHAQKTGFPGHWVFRCSTGFEIKCYTNGGGSQIVDQAQIKRGYYGRVYLSIRPNGDPVKPGLFVNPSVFELVGYGEEIASGPDGAALIASAGAAALPPGASSIPVAGAVPPAAGAVPPVGAGALPAAGPTTLPPTAAGAVPPVGAGALPAAGIQPAPDFLNPAGAVVPAALPPAGAALPPALPPATVPPALPPAAVPVMTALAGVTTYAQYIAAGWTDEQLRAGGLIQ